MITWLSGSRAYGTARDDGGSDTDLTEVYVEGRYAVITNTEAAASRSFKREGNDVQSHPLRRFVQLALKGNPNVLESLWHPTVGKVSEVGEELIASRHLFIGTHIIGPHRGYMKAQVERMVGTRGGHGTGDRPVHPAVGYDTKFAMHALRLGLQCKELLETGTLQCPRRDVEVLRIVRNGDVSFEVLWQYLLEVDGWMGDVILGHEVGWPPCAASGTVWKRVVDWHVREWKEQA